MENHAQALFMMAMDKQVVTKNITDHVCSWILHHALKTLSSLTLSAMNSVLMKLQMRVRLSSESVLDYSSKRLIAFLIRTFK